jgi:hypothetical protein
VRTTTATTTTTTTITNGVAFANVSRFYNSDTFSDVTILMLGQQPSPSKQARKSVTPVHTFHAHKSFSTQDLVYSQSIFALILRYDFKNILLLNASYMTEI